MPTMTPIDQQRRRAPEAGRIRIGIRSGRAMKAIDTFRFTSPHKEAIIELAEQYGGEPRPWDEPMANKGQWEIITPANSIEVMVVPNGLSTGYELWSGGGCERRCDGYVAEIAVRGAEELQETPCICNAKGVRECDPKTRLNVVLPTINFYGVWRLESKGWNAQEELPGMYDMIANFAQDGKLVRAFLNLEQRTSKKNGKTKHFVVPTLSLAHTPNQLMGGGVGESLSIEPAREPRGAPLASISGPQGEDVDPEENVIEAEVVDPEREAAAESIVREIATEHQLDPDSVVGVLWAMTNADMDKIESFIRKAGEGKQLRFTQNNTLAWRSA